MKLVHEYTSKGHRLRVDGDKRSKVGETALYDQPAFVLEYMALTSYYEEDQGVYQIKRIPEVVEVHQE